MGLIPWRNKQEVSVRKGSGEANVGQLRTEVNRLFDNFFSEPFSLFDSFANRGGASGLTTWLDVDDGEKQVNIALEVPGMNPDDIEISVNGSLLTIQGEKREEFEDKGKNYFHSERRFGSFRRVVELPSATKPDSVKANYKNGVLRITIDKAGETPRQRIPIST